MAGSILRPLKIGIDFQHHLFDDRNKGLTGRRECNGMGIALKELRDRFRPQAREPAGLKSVAKH
jgi:hypothetical protein